MEILNKARGENDFRRPTILNGRGKKINRTPKLALIEGGRERERKEKGRRLETENEEANLAGVCKVSKQQRAPLPCPRIGPPFPYRCSTPVTWNCPSSRSQRASVPIDRTSPCVRPDAAETWSTNSSSRDTARQRCYCEAVGRALGSSKAL